MWLKPLFNGVPVQCRVSPTKGTSCATLFDDTSLAVLFITGDGKVTSCAGWPFTWVQGGSDVAEPSKRPCRVISS